jgi:hypothetical protein
MFNKMLVFFVNQVLSYLILNKFILSFKIGPKLFKRLTGKSNKLSIINSLNQLVLAGTVNAQIRKQVIEVKYYY